MTSLLPLRLRWLLLFRRHGGPEAARRLGMNVGDGCRILSFDVASEPWLITIGDRTTVSSQVLFVTHDGAGWLFRRSDETRPYRFARIRVGDDCFIGARSVIMPGVSIGDRCIVAAGTVVHRSIPAGSIVGGNPARIIGGYKEYRDKVIETWKWTADRGSGTYREQIDSIVDPTFLTELAV